MPTKNNPTGQYASSEFQRRSNGVNYYKTCVKRRNSDILRGTRSLAEYPEGHRLERAIKNLQADVNNGAYTWKEPKEDEESEDPWFHPPYDDMAEFE